ncbi:MAG: DUF3524 domain-containing protein [Desulfarculaceae bacterium]|nr:DUF3524 domain-containing protein [Desulfarculaceae bacterium]
MQRLNIVFLEPFCGGSHKDFSLGWQANSAHDIELLTLPDRFWKWRMRGSALYFAKRMESIDTCDAVAATDMMNVADLRAFSGNREVPLLLYFHENQLTYPEGPGEKRTGEFGYINLTSALAADRVVFNSQFHRDRFFQAAESLIQNVPDHPPEWIMEDIRNKTGVLYPGCRFPVTGAGIPPSCGKPPLIVWNHRWEWDKQPEVFFSVLRDIRDAGVPFRLALVGESYERIPKVFARAEEDFSDHITAFGYVESRQKYLELLSQGTVVVSTAIQENFGISVVEAVRMGCFPLLPERLSYPEIMPERFHDQVIYSDRADLVKKLTHLLLNPGGYDSTRQILSGEMEKFSWDRMAPAYDREILRLLAKV